MLHGKLEGDVDEAGGSSFSGWRVCGALCRHSSYALLQFFYTPEVR
jgi:hypothetical protein